MYNVLIKILVNTDIVFLRYLYQIFKMQIYQSFENLDDPLKTKERCHLLLIDIHLTAFEHVVVYVSF